MPDERSAVASRSSAGARDDGLTGVRVIARLLDSAVGLPGTGVRVGLDPLLGLVPGLGDVAGAALSGYIVLVAARRGAPASVVVRMLGNIAVDTAVGAVPLLGDLFDAGWQSNMRNVALLERHLAVPGEARATNRLVVAATFVVLVVLAAVGLWCTFLVLHALGTLLGRAAG